MYIQFGVMIVAVTYTALGIIGFLPIDAINPVHPEGIGVRYLFNLVAINGMHNLIHLGIGVSGLAVMRDPGRTRVWGKVVGTVLLLVFAGGMVQAYAESLPRDQSLLNLVPLNSPGHMLHLATGVIALYLGLAKAPKDEAAGKSGAAAN